MTWTLSDYISQTLAQFGSQLSPEIIEAMEDTYNSGLLGQIFDTAQALGRRAQPKPFCASCV